MVFPPEDEGYFSDLPKVFRVFRGQLYYFGRSVRGMCKDSRTFGHVKGLQSDFWRIYRIYTDPEKSSGKVIKDREKCICWIDFRWTLCEKSVPWIRTICHVKERKIWTDQTCARCKNSGDARYHLLARWERFQGITPSGAEYRALSIWDIQGWTRRY